MPKKRPAIASQKGEPPASSITPRSSASTVSAKRGAVLLDEQIAAAREQHAEPAGALVRVEEQAADLASDPSKSVHQGQHLGAEGPAELLATSGSACEIR